MTSPSRQTKKYSSTNQIMWYIQKSEKKVVIDIANDIYVSKKHEKLEK